MNWTEEQRRAIEMRGRRVLVSAGAGSGKTRVLVERFIRLLEENPDWRVTDIWAVTFTEKAAREMRARIRREIRRRIEQSDAPADRRRWRAHRNDLDSARIGTIHALCAALLRAHPAEVGLDPAFEVLEEVEAAQLMERAVQETLAELARAESPFELAVFARLSPHEVRQALHQLLAEGERAAGALERIASLDAEGLLGRWREAVEAARWEAARQLAARPDWQAAARAICRLAAHKTDDRREQCRAQVAALLAELSEALTAGDAERALARFEDIARAIDLRGGSKKAWPSEDDFAAVGEALKALREAVRNEALLRLAVNDADRAAAELARCMASLYGKARRRFAALKRERGAVDFNDLEELAERLLTEYPEVRELYNDPARGRLRALMVDEYQDTSPIQSRILRRLTPRSNEVFVIGDAKQSIYRFRGADVTVFHEARAEFGADGGAELHLGTCFRAHARLVGFVNHLFPAVLTVESHYDVAYEAMRATREAADDRPSVELHLIAADEEAEEKLRRDELRDVEATVVAGLLREIVEGGEPLVCDDEAGRRAARWGDVALLFQASTSFEIYEQALARAGVPYMTIAGRGFYDRQEITDLANLLGFLSSPVDDLRLAAVLRSPLFALSDETLLRLRLRGGFLWAALSDETFDLGGEQGEAVRMARGVLRRLREQAGRAPAHEILTRALSETGYLAALLMLRHGERRVANVEKFIEQMRGWAGLTLAEVAGRVEDLQFREAREGEAAMEEAGAVRLMTVHKAKGLEFPIVCIADATYAGPSAAAALLTHPELGPAFRITLDGAAGEPLRPAVYEMLRRLEERMEAAEKKRLLYVAATRARDHLVVSGVEGRGGWMARLFAALGIDPDDPPEEIPYPEGRVIFRRHIVRQPAEAAPAAAFAAASDAPAGGDAGDDWLALLGPLGTH